MADEVMHLAKQHWRKRYRVAVEGCDAAPLRAQLQSLFRLLMTGADPVAARADARALIGVADDGEAPVARLRELGKQAHTLVRLAHAAFEAADGNFSDAVVHLDWASLTGIDPEIIDTIGHLERSLGGPPQTASRRLADDPDRRMPSAEPAPSVLPNGLRPEDEVRSVPADELSLDAFAREHFKPEVPVVVRGVARGWPALDRWADLSYLSSVFGHRVIPVEVGRSALRESAGGWTERAMPLDRFVDAHLLPSNRAARAGRRLADGDIAYCAQHPLIDQVPALRADFSEPVYCAAAGERARVVNCWLGTADTCTPLHFDSYDNLLVQLAGCKLVRLLARSETPKLYVSASGGVSVAAQGNVSPVDVDAPDLDRHPLYASARASWCVLRPGDGLFLPSRYWHHVRSLSTSCSLNFWF